jgi:hypothetical protein
MPWLLTIEALLLLSESVSFSVGEFLKTRSSLLIVVSAVVVPSSSVWSFRKPADSWRVAVRDVFLSRSVV